MGFCFLDEHDKKREVVVVFKNEEVYSKKSIILVSRIEIDNEGERMIDIKDRNKLNADIVEDHYLKDANRVKH
jgi:hypothetical protein